MAIRDATTIAHLVDRTATGARVRPIVDNNPPAFTRSEARKLFDETAKRYLGVSGAQFLKRWKARECDVRDPKIIRVAMLLPLVTRVRKKSV